MNVYVVGNAKNYASFIYDANLVDDMSDADIIIFTGGEDVDPSLYGASKIAETYSNITRDKYETEMFNKIKPNQLVVGVCRGSQFLCVMNGGLLCQDVYGHAIWGTHIITNGDMGYDITSTHHQMQCPYNLNDKDYDVLYYAYNGDDFNYEGIEEYSESMYSRNPEIVLYHKDKMPKCLAIQGHPEVMRKDAPVVKMINDLIKTLL